MSRLLESSASLSETSPRVGEALHDDVAEILPLRRCITGDGLRATLAAIGRRVPIEVTEVPSGTDVLDWTVPDEWSVRDAYVALEGRRVVDWQDSALHLVQYSQAFRGRLTFDDLRPHLHSLPDQPDLVPYRTSYYGDSWGFCLAHRDLEAIESAAGRDRVLEVVVDAEKRRGSMSYGEVVFEGETDAEILLSAHACHPALANDNAASIAVATMLAERLLDRPKPRHTVRFVFAPGTIGAITWLDRNRDRLDRIVGGFVLANLGDAGPMVYKRSRPGTLGTPAPADRALEVAARDLDVALEVRPFAPTGYDERQYGSPGFNLPIGRLTRTPHGEYPEYHTSGDDLDLVKPWALEESLFVLEAAVCALDADARYLNRKPHGEPQLGRRGLYNALGGPGASQAQQAMLWVLNLSDGEHSALEVAQRSGLPFDAVRRAIAALEDADLLAHA
ncbi:DUF4910 domain-containing protein [Rubrivirga sp.]|uniref:DUF4910 domain-containing protein n=1 Tax=Rubrivirga sp. TaxID=1885344 RepID=UPI003C71D98C